MTKHELVAPPVGTIYQLRRYNWRARLHEHEYWQVERRTEKPCGYVVSLLMRRESRCPA